MPWLHALHEFKHLAFVPIQLRLGLGLWLMSSFPKFDWLTPCITLIAGLLESWLSKLPHGLMANSLTGLDLGCQHLSLDAPTINLDTTMPLRHVRTLDTST